MKVIIRNKIVSGLSSRMHQITDNSETLKDLETKKNINYLLREVFDEKEHSYENLNDEYETFLKNGESKIFSWMYILNNNFGLVIDSNIYLYHYNQEMYEQQKEILPWVYMESKKYLGDTWWFNDEEIIRDIQELPLLDFLLKYKGY